MRAGARGTTALPPGARVASLAPHPGAYCSVRSVPADWVVPPVEAFAASLPPQGKHHLPVQSLLVATEPLPSLPCSDTRPSGRVKFCSLMVMISGRKNSFQW